MKEEEEESDVEKDKEREKLAPDVERTRRAPRSYRFRQVKRKAAAAANSTKDIVADEDSDKDYEGDSTEHYDEEYELSNDCSNSSLIQGPKLKKSKQNPRQGTNDKIWEEMYLLVLEYKVQHGNTLVPLSYDKNPKLARWIHAKTSALKETVVEQSCPPFRIHWICMVLT